MVITRPPGLRICMRVVLGGFQAWGGLPGPGKCSKTMNKHISRKKKSGIFPIFFQCFSMCFLKVAAIKIKTATNFPQMITITQGLSCTVRQNSELFKST